MTACDARRRLTLMVMRLPIDVWAMLVRGHEAESEEVEQVVGNGHEIKGVGLIQRWREYDGERCWPWRGPPYHDHEPEESRTQYVVQRMQWKRRAGKWYGEWVWESYDRSIQWEQWYDAGESPSFLYSWLPDYPALAIGAINSESGGTVPQEVLLGLVRELEGSVSISFSGPEDAPTDVS